MDFQDLQHPIVSAIYKSYEEAAAKEPKRGYLGASIIGAKCERYLWYIFRECAEEKFEGRMLRLFDNGDCEEARMIKDLQAIGCVVHPFQPLPLPADGTSGYPPEAYFILKEKQWEITDLGDHFSGHLDAIMQGLDPDSMEWYVNEFKTHNKRSFEDLVAYGVKTSQPKHYAQMQVYMHKMGIRKALYLAVNKNNEELHVEIVEYNQDEAETLMLKAKRIITATEPPPRWCLSRDTFECRYCCANSICWGNPNLKKPEDALPRKSCRQCWHSEPDIDKSKAWWTCNQRTWHKTNPLAAITPCEHFTLIPGILPEEK